ncbi:MAG: DEAD/DEAH box helicase [Spirosomataceae bacterium]
MSFESLGLHPALLQALAEENYQQPTPIQEKAIPVICQGKDLLGCAQTGTGKTAAFALPILQRLLEHSPSRSNYPRAVIITPTRELAIQIGDSFKTYGRHTAIQTSVIFGGVKAAKQMASLKGRVDVLVATPGRFLDLFGQGYIRLNQLQVFVLDEADRMLDMGFIHDIKRIIQLLPTERQNLFFSATMPPAITKLAQNLLVKPVRVEVTPVSSTAETIQQQVYWVDKSDKMALLLSVLSNSAWNPVLVFTRTKHGADKVTKQLEKKGIRSAAIHGNKSQNNRQRALEDFKSGQIRVLVATDIAARGIDIDNLQYVINFEVPEVAETYVHRIGRSGRAGNSGRAVTFCMPEEKADWLQIERLIKQKIEASTWKAPTV